MNARRWPPALLGPASLAEGGDPGGTDHSTCALSVTLGLLSSPRNFRHSLATDSLKQLLFLFLFFFNASLRGSGVGRGGAGEEPGRTAPGLIPRGLIPPGLMPPGLMPPGLIRGGPAPPRQLPSSSVTRPYVDLLCQTFALSRF